MDNKPETMKIDVSQEVFDNIEKVMAEATAKFIAELPTLVHRRLEGAVAKVLGFDNGWGEWKIDHCNGRMSTMSDFIGSKAREAAKAAVDSIDFKTTKELQNAIYAEYVDVFKSQMRDKIRDHAGKHVQAVLDKAANAHSIEIETLGRIPTKKDLANPSFGKKPMEKLIMETLVASKTKVKEGEE